MRVFKKYLIYVLFFLAFSIFCFSVYKIWDYYHQAKQDAIPYIDLQEEYGTDRIIPEILPYPSPIQKPKKPVIYEEVEGIEEVEEEIVDELEPETPQYTYNFEELSQINKDIQGWLYIPETYIDYPVVLGSNNSYYLKHDFNQSYNNLGCLFFDYRTDFEKDDVNIIYGHNMIGNSRKLLRTEMFSSLILWLDEAYFNEHPYIYYTTENGTDAYRIYAITTMNISNMNEHFCYIERNLESEEEFNVYIQNIDKFAVYKNTEKPKYGNSLLVLSTCYPPKQNKNGRLVIFAEKTNVTEANF